MVSVILVSIYLLVLLAGSFRKSAADSDADSYLLAGRKLALFPFVATMVTTAYGWILGIGQLYYEYGISAWLFLSLPYTTFALVMAFFLSKKIREEQIHSIPELLQKHYGKWVSKFGALLVLLLISPAMYALMTSQLLASIFRIPTWICLVLALLFSSAYIYRGGFQSIANKDGYKFLFMFGGFVITLIYLIHTYGTSPLESLGSEKITFTFSAHLWEIITWFILATVVLTDPGYHQRIYSSRTPQVAKRGLLISVICWTVFDFLAASIALYGLGLMPNLPNPALVYPLLANDFLPPVLGAVFILGLLATVMSTRDSFLFLSAQTLMLDLFGKKTDTGKYMRIGLLLVSVLTFLLLIPYLESNAVDFFFDFTPYMVCVLVPPVLSVFTPRFRLRGYEVGIQMTLAVLACFTWNQLSIEITHDLSAVVPGAALVILYQMAALLLKKREQGIHN